MTFVEKRARPKIACSPSWRGRIEFTMKMGDKKMMTFRELFCEDTPFVAGPFSSSEMLRASGFLV